jgi:hypothetical protein
MRAEELYESLRVATDPEAATGRSDLAGTPAQEKERWLQQFAITLGTDENDETTTFNGTIPQTLMMMNGPMVRRATNCEPGTFLDAVVTSDASQREKLTLLYTAALGRPPSRSEIDQARLLWAARQGDAAEAYQDVWWVLLNSGEFLLNH